MDENYSVLALSELLKQEREQIVKYEKALQDIITRSNTDPLGTSKVQDMRKIAEKALNNDK